MIFQVKNSMGVNRKSWQYSKLDKHVTVRFKKLGDLGEFLAEELLNESGFKNVKNLNKAEFLNNPFFDIYAERDRYKYAISVKTRNKYENSVAGIKLNSRYKLTDDPKKFVEEARSKYNSEAAWVAISADIDKGVFDAYFGTLLSLFGNRKGINMSRSAVEGYEHLALLRSFEEMGIPKKEYLCLENTY